MANPLRDAEALIAKCRAEMRASVRLLRAARRRVGLCIACGKPAQTYARCLSCREKARKVAERLRRSA
jgi:hypothetical protein